MKSDGKIVVVVCGPTAVGKTSFAIQLAQHLQTEILSADSRQCYKELNIGVAKPTPVELATIPHHFINSHSIHQQVNAGVFEQFGLRVLDQVFANNKYAVMVGGTGLYINALCDGIDEMPQTPAEIREALNQSYQQKGLTWLQSEVQKKDLAFWKVAEQQNPHRLLRALEVLQTSGKSITTYRQQKQVSRPFTIVKIGLQLPRQDLNQRINTRVDQMIADGLEAEVKSLLPYQYLQALQTVGYKEFFDYFNSIYSRDQAIERIKINTRQYAKRQMTWFKKDPSIQWFSATPHVHDVDELLKASTA